MFPLNVAAAAAAASVYELIAGVSGNALFLGYSAGDPPNDFGSLDPLDYQGIQIASINTSTGNAAAFWLQGAGNAETIWNVISMTGNFGSGNETITWDRVADGFVYVADNAGITTWTAAGVGAPNFVNGNTYQVSIS